MLKLVLKFQNAGKIRTLSTKSREYLNNISKLKELIAAGYKGVTANGSWGPWQLKLWNSYLSKKPLTSYTGTDYTDNRSDTITPLNQSTLVNSKTYKYNPTPKNSTVLNKIDAENNKKKQANISKQKELRAAGYTNINLDGNLTKQQESAYLNLKKAQLSAPKAPSALDSDPKSYDSYQLKFDSWMDSRVKLARETTKLKDDKEEYKLTRALNEYRKNMSLFNAVKFTNPTGNQNPLHPTWSTNGKTNYYVTYERNAYGIELPIHHSFDINPEYERLIKQREYYASHPGPKFEDSWKDINKTKKEFNTTLNQLLNNRLISPEQYNYASKHFENYYNNRSLKQYVKDIHEALTQGAKFVGASLALAAIICGGALIASGASSVGQLASEMWESAKGINKIGTGVDFVTNTAQGTGEIMAGNTSDGSRHLLSGLVSGLDIGVDSAKVISAISTAGGIYKGVRDTEKIKNGMKAAKTYSDFVYNTSHGEVLDAMINIGEGAAQANFSALKPFTKILKKGKKYTGYGAEVNDIILSGGSNADALAYLFRQGLKIDQINDAFGTDFTYEGVTQG